MKKEVRYFKGELRAAPSDGKVFITGRAASYNTRSENLGLPGLPIYEELAPGCFDDALDADDVDTIHCVDHDPSRLLGKVSSGKTQITTDSRGLIYKTEAPNTTSGRDLLEHIHRGDAQFSSFAFSMDSDDQGAQVWSKIPDPDDPDQEADLRTIVRIHRLHDVSTLTGFPPAYPETAAGLSDRFASAPPEIQVRFSHAADNDDDLDPEDLCGCDCGDCEDGRCQECSNPDCRDEACAERDCPYASNRSAPGAAGDAAAVLQELNELALEEALEEL